jgi:DNA-binding response OmpR family regulator
MMEALALIELHGIAIDPRKWTVVVEGAVISLTSFQFRLLHLLAKNAGKVLSRRQIAGRIYGPDHEVEVTEHSINVEICALRKKLGDHAQLIETKRGVGYCFRA